jgi:16S rRNA (guanine527-N7)-methyltransferase
MTLSDKTIITTLAPYGVETGSSAICEAIRAYVDLLLRWNRKIALTTVVDPIEILRFHFGESMFVFSAVPIRHGRLADVGTGAGFPAIPISMLSPDLECILIESNLKKAAFLAEVIRSLDLKRVEIYRGRMEDFPPSPKRLDFSISRALGMHKAFLDWSAAQLKPTGQIVLWIGDADGARIRSDSAWNWRTSIRIPGSDHRALLIGSPLIDD